MNRSKAVTFGRRLFLFYEKVPIGLLPVQILTFGYGPFGLRFGYTGPRGMFKKIITSPFHDHPFGRALRRLPDCP